jgi:hypothetical protein
VRWGTDMATALDSTATTKRRWLPVDRTVRVSSSRTGRTARPQDLDGLLAMIAWLAGEYARYAYARPGSLPAPLVAFWVSLWIWNPINMLLVFPLLLFPTGRSLSRRWRPVIWLAVALTVAWTAVGALSPWFELPDGDTIANPMGVAVVGRIEMGGLDAVLSGLILFLQVAAVVSLVIRFRRSRGVERQQLKWFAYAGALVLLVPLTSFVAPSLLNVSLVVITALPISVGIAVLRYRLYDIDRLINRTLVYGSLTAILGLIYAGPVLVLGQVFGGAASNRPSWAVAGVTLAVAALFQPARRRIQTVVDRRFNRRKYDAAKTIEAYSVRLRDQLDLDTLSTELLAVVDQTMEPTQMSLWLRPSAPGSRAHPGSGARPNSWAY